MDGIVNNSSFPQLRLDGIHKTLGNKSIVSGADLTVKVGESIVLLGPSGCGKSTTLRMVAGFIEPDAGRISIEGKLVSGDGISIPTEKRRLGMVFQSYAVWPHKSVFENVAFGLRIAGDDRQAIQQKVQKVLELVHLDKLADRYPNELSGGQQQRVALARAIVGEPRLLLLDEPLSNLDASLREELRIELRRLHKEKGMTMLYVTHDQEEALVLADRIAVMDGGKIVQFDVPEVVYNRPASTFVASFIGSPNMLAGRVAHKDESGSQLGVQTDIAWQILGQGGRDFVAQCRGQERVTVVIRPEDLQLTDDTDGFAAHVVDVAFLGTSYETTVDVNGTRLRARTRTRPVFQDGMTKLQVKPAAAWVVPCQ
ncbi:ABC transporter ATP-binding protein [Ensifer adhaerens]|uniref:ABC transporter ATP-binding protein n=1 Tax=Ensifer adhaerens TaxID=106592 RepID=A0A9Q9DEB5_ENSAD|nr:ABC transporter ATP-binding protein [Ensifer adhaerens]USJ28524.1 ABC transporter ATP-binding protein [Ensifer adhaerens]